MAVEMHVYQGLRLVEDGVTIFELGSLDEPVVKATGKLQHHQHYTLAAGETKTIFQAADTGRFAAAIVIADGFLYLEYKDDVDGGGKVTRSSLSCCLGLWQAVWGDDCLTNADEAAHAANTFAGEAAFIDDLRVYNPDPTDSVEVDVYVIGNAT